MTTPKVFVAWTWILITPLKGSANFIGENNLEIILQTASTFAVHSVATMNNKCVPLVLKHFYSLLGCIALEQRAHSNREIENMNNYISTHAPPCLLKKLAMQHYTILLSL